MLLKGKPYVNIIDYIDAARIGAKIEVFNDFEQFSHYTRTTRGKRIHLQYAKEDPLLAALLQARSDAKQQVAALLIQRDKSESWLPVGLPD